MSRFHPEAEVEATSTQFRLSTPEVLYLLIMQVMDLDLTQNTDGLPMSDISVFNFTPLSDYDSSFACAATCASDTLLEGASTPSMCNTTEFFGDNGVTLI